MIEAVVFVIFVALAIPYFLFWHPYRRNGTEWGAPFVPMEPEVVTRIMHYARLSPGEVFYELGSGDGRLVMAAAAKGAIAYGVELDRFRVWYSRFWIKLLRLGKNAHIIHANIFDVDLSGADVVFLYLLQETNEKLEAKLNRELKVGARVISAAFNFPGWKPITVDPEGPIYGPLYIYEKKS